ncbi:MAG: hypothetical protein E2O40_02380 [Planctomycetota bacterium]|nr:MAG: hypothetical protein E2O40_02380 [Planctomycetota bacterium]
MTNDAIFCVGCGYDLRTLPIEGPCPECGRAIAESLGGRRLAAADSRWLARLATGQSLVSWGLPLAIVGFCLMPLLGMVMGILSYMGGLSVTAMFIVLAILAVAVVSGLVLVWIGAILVTAPDPSESDTEAPDSARRLARWGLASTIGIIFLAVVVAWLPIPVTVTIVAGIILRLLAAVSVTVGLTALLRCLAGHATRIPDQELARRTDRMRRVLGWTLPAFLIAMMIGPALASLQVLVPALAGINVNALQSIFGLTGVAIGGVVLFMLARLSTRMRQYRQAFRGARDEASARHAGN